MVGGLVRRCFWIKSFRCEYPRDDMQAWDAIASFNVESEAQAGRMERRHSLVVIGVRSDLALSRRGLRGFHFRLFEPS